MAHVSKISTCVMLVIFCTVKVVPVVLDSDGVMSSSRAIYN